MVDLTTGGLATLEHRGPSLDAAAAPPATTCSTPAPACRPREVWRTVTATGPTCVAANTASTAAVVLGADAPSWLDERGVAARLVAADGRTVRPVGGLAAGRQERGGRH